MDLIASGHAVEDARAELKREWIDPQKAARQLAAHASAARGESILWLIGVDEKQGVIGVAHAELSAWFNSVASCFEGLPPSCADLNVPREGRAITALLFDTARAPSVVKNPSHGKVAGEVIACEVPWREGRQPRGARKEDLLRLLVRALHVPAIEWLEARLTNTEHIPAGEVGPPAQGRAALRVAAVGTRVCGADRECSPGDSFPSLRSLGEAAWPDRAAQCHVAAAEPVAEGSIDLVADSHTIAATGSQGILAGPGVVEIDAELQTGLPGRFDAAGVATISIRLRLGRGEADRGGPATGAGSVSRAQTGDTRGTLEAQGRCQLIARGQKARPDPIMLCYAGQPMRIT